MADKLLEIKGVSKIFRVGGMIRGKKLVAVDDVTLSIDNDKPEISKVFSDSMILCNLDPPKQVFFYFSIISLSSAPSI